MARAIWRSAVSGTAMLLMACSEASATYVGDRYFVSTLATTVPTPADFANVPHVVVLPEVGETRETDLPFTFSKLITKEWSILFTETFRSIDDAGDTRSGFDDLVIGTQYQLITDPVHQFVFTVGGTAALGGTGSSHIDAAEFSTFTPTIYWGKGFGDLPDTLGWLQPVTITGNLAVALPTDNSTATGGMTTIHPDVLDWSFAFEYALLTNNERDGLRYPLGIVPLVEVALTTPLEGPNAGDTTGTINPGIIWVTKPFQLGLEAIIPINERSGDDIGVRAQIHWYFSNIFPNSLGKPLFD